MRDLFLDCVRLDGVHQKTRRFAAFGFDAVIQLRQTVPVAAPTQDRMVPLARKPCRHRAANACACANHKTNWFHA